MSASRREQLITIGVTAATITVFSLLLIWPRSKTLGAIRSYNSRLLQQIDNVSRELEGIRAISNAVESLEQRLKEAREKVPAEDHGYTYEPFVRDLAQKLELYDEDQPDPDFNVVLADEEEHEGIIIRNVRIGLDAKFETFFDFLRALETGEKLTEIDFLRLRNTGRGNELEVELNLYIFYGKL